MNQLGHSVTKDAGDGPRLSHRSEISRVGVEQQRVEAVTGSESTQLLSDVAQVGCPRRPGKEGLGDTQASSVQQGQFTKVGAVIAAMPEIRASDDPHSGRTRDRHTLAEYVTHSECSNSPIAGQLSPACGLCEARVDAQRGDQGTATVRHCLRIALSEEDAVLNRARSRLNRKVDALSADGVHHDGTATARRLGDGDGDLLPGELALEIPPPVQTAPHR